MKTVLSTKQENYITNTFNELFSNMKILFKGAVLSSFDDKNFEALSGFGEVKLASLLKVNS